MLTSDLPNYNTNFSHGSYFFASLLSDESQPESFQLVIFYDGLKNILQQHLLLEEGQSDISVAKQPLWLLFCCAGPLTRFSDKVASVRFDSSAMLETCRNQRRECVLLMCLCKLYAKRHILIWSYGWECKCRNGKWLKVSVYNDAWYSLFSCIILKKIHQICTLWGEPSRSAVRTAAVTSRKSPWRELT